VGGGEREAIEMREGGRNPRNGEERLVDWETFILQQGIGKLLELLQ
jgi:hypothetical protein